MKSQAERLFAIHLKEAFPDLDWEREVMFHKDRRWRFDFACWALFLAIEIEGVTSFGDMKKLGRHQTAKGFIEDCEKYNEAAIYGWTILRFPHSEVIRSMEPIEKVKRAVRVCAEREELYLKAGFEVG